MKIVYDDVNDAITVNCFSCKTKFCFHGVNIECVIRYIYLFMNKELHRRPQASYLLLAFNQVAGQTSFLQRSYPLNVSKIQAPDTHKVISPSSYR